ncbi:MAG: alpha/beta hydrolase [Leptospiraceae bacterium]|nr:alpha/beta hydrolase [Leptospiraceae bacterium]
MKQIKSFLFKLGVVLILFFTLSVYFIAYLRMRVEERETKTSLEIAPKNGKFQNVNGHDIYYQSFGDETKPAVLFIHGMGSWSELWRPVAEKIAESGYYTIAIDLPPFGFSERQSMANIDSCQNGVRINEFLDSLKINKANLVAHSFGSSAALCAVLLNKEKFNKLIFVDAAVSLDKIETPISSRLLTSPLYFEYIQKTILASTILNFNLTGYFFKKFVYIKEAITEEKIKIIQLPLQLKATSSYLGEYLFRLTADDNSLAENFIEKKGSLPQNIEFIWGEKDSVTPLSRGEELQKLFPNSKLSVMRNVGHIPQLENEKEFIEILQKILQY